MSDAAAWLAQTLAQQAGYAGGYALAEPAAGDAAFRWRSTGLAELTGPADADPIQPRRDYAARLEALVRTTQSFAAALGGAPSSLGVGLYAERAADLGLSRQGAASAGGAARMLRCADGWLVANLARPEDLDLFEAWIGEAAGDDPWQTLSAAVRRRKAQTLVNDARLLGLPVAQVDAPGDEQRAARPQQAKGAPHIQRWGPINAPRDLDGLLAVDLSGLWAGPLCGRLLAELGVRVIKVESTHRPDGARNGSPAFFERMNAKKQSAAFDFKTKSGRDALRDLIEQADVVIEAARPRAMAQLGIDPAEIAQRREHLVWISLTAYGRSGPWSNAVGFGDDCAAAAGLVVRDTQGSPMFVGDALADPVAGLMASAACLAVLAAGGGALIDVGLREAALFVAQAPAV